MNELQLFNESPGGYIPKTMSSREIAELTGKEHKSVLRDIRNLIDSLNKNNGHTSVPVGEIKKDYHRWDRTQYKYLSEKTQDAVFNFCFGNSKNSEYVFVSSEYKDSKGEIRPQYELNKKAALLLASGYDVVLRAKIIDRWEELETRGQQPYKLPQTFSEALRELADTTEANEKLQLQIEQEKATNKENAPKVLFSNAVQTSKTAILIGELAKILKQNGIEIGQNRMFEWLRNNGFLISRKGTDYNMPTQRSMELGLFEIKETVISHSDGHISVSKTPKVTGKGQIYFVNKFLNINDQTIN